MVRKYVYGTPFHTEAVIRNIKGENGSPNYGTICLENGFSFTYTLKEKDVVYGLGESNRGINKRGGFGIVCD